MIRAREIGLSGKHYSAFLYQLVDKFVLVHAGEAVAEQR